MYVPSSLDGEAAGCIVLDVSRCRSASARCAASATGIAAPCTAHNRRRGTATGRSCGGWRQGLGPRYPRKRQSRPWPTHREHKSTAAVASRGSEEHAGTSLRMSQPASSVRRPAGAAPQHAAADLPAAGAQARRDAAQDAAGGPGLRLHSAREPGGRISGHRAPGRAATPPARAGPAVVSGGVAQSARARPPLARLVSSSPFKPGLGAWRPRLPLRAQTPPPPARNVARTPCRVSLDAPC